MSSRADQPEPIEALAVLGDPVRRRLFRAVRTAGVPLTREEAAARVGVSRKLAAFHLDKLVAARLLVAGTDDTRPRRVGRVPKAYRPAATPVSVSIPGRSYELLASILLDASAHPREGESPEQARLRVAGAAGRSLAHRAREKPAVQPTEPARTVAPRTLDRVEQVLEREGFEPFRPHSDAIRLRNCPFHPLAEREPEVVCGINHAYLGGLLEGLRAGSLEARLEPAAGECCVAVARKQRR